MGDTICALASGPPPSAISIIRISGPAVLPIMETCLGGALEARTATLRPFTDNMGKLVDECLAIFMASPASYTGEDVLELFVHGGRAIVEHALEALLAVNGVRLAEAGEFTRRAFEAGKLDLLEAEGVADVIDAETRAQKDQGLRQLGGALSQTYTSWRNSLLQVLALLEGSIDFPDEDDAPDKIDGPVLEIISRLTIDMETALGDDHIGERIRDGFRVAISGPPNAGKSSLLNYFAGRSAAIVTDMPGTTRDVIEVRRVISGAIVWFLDTAGLRETEDVIEAEGVRRARAAAANADLRIHMIDGAVSEPQPDQFSSDDILVVNKIDIASTTSAPGAALRVSVRTGEGLDQLDKRLASWVDARVSKDEPALITRRRHREGLSTGVRHLKAAREALLQGIGAELVAEDVRLAARTLDGLLGVMGVEDILGAVFSQFCIGK